MIGVSTVETTSIKKSNSLEGDIEEYGQKNISTLQRNLLNVDEILRIPSNKLDKVIYKEHPLAIKLKDSPISKYNPKWTKNVSAAPIKEKSIEKPVKEKEKLGWNNF